MTTINRAPIVDPQTLASTPAAKAVTFNNTCLTAYWTANNVARSEIGNNGTHPNNAYALAQVQYLYAVLAAAQTALYTPGTRTATPAAQTSVWPWLVAQFAAHGIALPSNT